MQNITKKSKLVLYLLPYAFVAVFLIVSGIFITGCQGSPMVYTGGLNEGITPVQYPAPQQSPYYYTGIWNGYTVYLELVQNVNVESLPDATLVGTLSGFYTNQPTYLSPPYAELNGESLNVWTAPAEFPGEYVVHNGDQGSQPTYGTWIILTQFTAPPAPVAPPQSPPPYMPPVQPQVGIGVAPAPLFVFGLGDGINVYFLTSLSTYIYEYNGLYFNWENNGWLYSTTYYGPWQQVTPVVVIPVPLLYGPPPPVIAYEPYFRWWRLRIGPFYRMYHPRWWYRHRVFIRHYTIWKKVVIKKIYVRRPFYRGKIHPIIDPHRGRLIFPRGTRPVLGPHGKVIYPKMVHRLKVRLPPIPIRRQMPSIHPLPPVRYYKLPKAIRQINKLKRRKGVVLPPRKIFPVSPPVRRYHPPVYHPPVHPVYRNTKKKKNGK